jgi:hypothetical protein
MPPPELYARATAEDHDPEPMSISKLIGVLVMPGGDND